MALTNTQINITAEMQNIGKEMLGLKSRMEVASAMYIAEGMSSLDDGDFSGYPDFENINSAELLAAKGAMDNILTTLGDYSGGENAYRLMKILREIPT